MYDQFPKKSKLLVMTNFLSNAEAKNGIIHRMVIDFQNMIYILGFEFTTISKIYFLTIMHYFYHF